MASINAFGQPNMSKEVIHGKRWRNGNTPLGTHDDGKSTP